MMKKIYIFICLFSFVSLGVFANNSVNTEYVLGVGDQIKILVYDEPDLTIQTTISDDGKINYPFLGELIVTGQSIKDLQKTVYQGLKGDYLVSPSIQVSIISYRPFFILGEVKKPGAYAFQPGLTVERAIALAGGLTERASEDKIYLKKDNQASRELSKVSLRNTLLPGDTITVKQGFF